jgi:hypothetical protein
MVKIKLSQTSVAKLMTTFRLQAYFGAMTIGNGNQAFLICNQSFIGNKAVYFKSIG